MSSATIEPLLVGCDGFLADRGLNDLMAGTNHWSDAWLAAYCVVPGIGSWMSTNDKAIKK